jgi:hypothetical protein
MSICPRSVYFLSWLSAWIAGRSLFLRNLNGDSFRQATSQVQADTKFAEARETSAILQDSGS